MNGVVKRRPFLRCAIVLSAVATGCSAGGSGPPTPGNNGQQAGSSGGAFGAGSGGDANGASGGSAPSSGGSGPSDPGTPNPVSAPDGGHLPFGGYDPTVHFDWPESAQVGSCKAGHYSGSFTGMYASGLTFVGVPIPVAGNLSLTLAQSADGEFFEITGGHICGTADGLFPFKADVSGTLDCKTGQLVNGTLTNGAYYLGLPGIPGGTFDGPFPATYDKISHSFTGTWKVYEPKSANPPPIYGGNGDWNASYGAATATSQAGCVGDGGAP
jgi:hypothetical protein